MMRVSPRLVDKVHIDYGLDMGVLLVRLWVARCVGAERAAMRSSRMSRGSEKLHSDMYVPQSMLAPHLTTHQ